MWHTVVDQSKLQYTPTVANERCHNTLQYFFSDPFNIRQNSLFKISILAWTCYMYLAVDVIRQYVVWYCMISELGRGGTADIPKMRKKNLTGNTVLRTCMGISAVWTVADNWIVHEDGQYDSAVWRQVGYQISGTVMCCWHTAMTYIVWDTYTCRLMGQ